MSAPVGNENSKTHQAEEISVNLTVVMPRKLVQQLDDARKKTTSDCNRSAFIRGILEDAL